jgi:hypothetical protein
MRTLCFRRDLWKARSRKQSPLPRRLRNGCVKGCRLQQRGCRSVLQQELVLCRISSAAGNLSDVESEAAQESLKGAAGTERRGKKR